VYSHRMNGGRSTLNLTIAPSIYHYVFAA